MNLRKLSILIIVFCFLAFLCLLFNSFGKYCYNRGVKKGIDYGYKLRNAELMLLDTKPRFTADSTLVIRGSVVTKSKGLTKIKSIKYAFKYKYSDLVADSPDLGIRFYTDTTLKNYILDTSKNKTNF